MSAGKLEIKVIEGKGFKNSSAKYVKFSTSNESVRTKTQKGMFVQWDDTCTVRIHHGMTSLQIDIYEDGILYDKLAGTLGFPLQQICSVFQQDLWIDVIGGNGGSAGQLHVFLIFKPNAAAYPPLQQQPMAMPYQQQLPQYQQQVPIPIQQVPVQYQQPIAIQQQPIQPQPQALSPVVQYQSPSPVEAQPSQASFDQKIMPPPLVMHVQSTSSIGTGDIIGKLQVQVLNGKDMEKSGSLFHKDSYYVQLSVRPTKSVKTKQSETGKNNPIFNDLLVLKLIQGDVKLSVEAFDAHDNSFVGAGSLDLSTYLEPKNSKTASVPVMNKKGIYAGEIQLIVTFVPDGSATMSSANPSSPVNASSPLAGIPITAPSAPPVTSKAFEATPALSGPSAPSADTHLPPYEAFQSAAAPSAPPAQIVQPSEPPQPVTAPIPTQQVHAPYIQQQGQPQAAYTPYSAPQPLQPQFVPYPSQAPQQAPYVPYPSQAPQQAQYVPYPSQPQQGQYSPYPPAPHHLHHQAPYAPYPPPQDGYNPYPQASSLPPVNSNPYPGGFSATHQHPHH